MTPRTSDGYPLTELARAIDAQLQGQADLRITGVNSLEQAAPGDLALLVSHRLMEQAVQSNASAFIVPQYYPDLNGAQLVSAQPHFDFVRLTTRFFTKPPPFHGGSPTRRERPGRTPGQRCFHRGVRHDRPSHDHRGPGHDLPGGLFRRRRDHRS